MNIRSVAFEPVFIPGESAVKMSEYSAIRYEVAGIVPPWPARPQDMP
jgi:hypothetical protein